MREERVVARGRAARMAAFSRVGCTRFVSSTTRASASGSIQRLVPGEAEVAERPAPGTLAGRRAASLALAVESRAQRAALPRPDEPVEIAFAGERTRAAHDRVERGDAEGEHRLDRPEHAGVPACAGAVERERVLVVDAPADLAAAPGDDLGRARRAPRSARARRAPRACAPSRASLRGRAGDDHGVVRARRPRRRVRPCARERLADQDVAEVTVERSEALGRERARAHRAAALELLR